ncbi:MAG: cell division protein ZapA [Burkholderiaceae bacterium]
MATNKAPAVQAPSEQIEVVILDRDFKLAVAPSEKPQLERAVRLVDEKMRSLRDTGKIAGIDRIAVMAALQIANELVALRGASPKGSAAEKNLNKIRRMNDDLEAELKRQESLF